MLLSITGAPRKHATALAAVVVCLLALAGVVQAQTQATPASPGHPLLSDGAVQSARLSLPQAMRAAVEWHPSVRTTAQQILQATEGIETARAGYYPQVRGGINSQLSNRNIGSYESRRLNTVDLSVSQMLYDFGKVASAVDQAEASVAATKAQSQLSADEVARETAFSWIEIHRQKELGEIAREQISGVQALTDLVFERARKGASSRSDVAQAQSRVEAARAQQLTADAQLARWRVNLMHLTGSRLPVDITDTPPAALDGACRAGMGTQPVNPPAVQLADAQREIAKADLRAAEAQLLPTLSLDGSVGRGLDARSRLPGENGLNTTVGLNFSAPLYEGGGNQSRKRAAAYALSAADAARAQAELAARQALEDALAQSQGQVQRLPVLAARVDSIRSTRDLYKQQYLQLGTRSLLDLLNAEQEYHAVRFEQAESAHELQRLAVQCLHQTGQLRAIFGIDDLRASAAGSVR
jgi:adhesin transport system outer membrane protein